MKYYSDDEQEDRDRARFGSYNKYWRDDATYHSTRKNKKELELPDPPAPVKIDRKASCLNCDHADWVNGSVGRCRAIGALPLAFQGGWINQAHPYRECPRHQYPATKPPLKRIKLKKRKS